MSRLVELTVAATLCAAPAAAQTWTAAPTVADMAAAYPEKAKAQGVGGAVDLVCTVQRGGGFDDCAVLGEQPRNLGFGPAARRLAEEKLKVAGVTKGQEIQIPMTFPADLAKGGVFTVKTPVWAALPTVADMQSAALKTQGGPNNVRVTLVCDVQAAGALSGCAVDREEPAGQGFGQAILTLAPKFQVALMSAEGMPTVGGKVRVPVRFELKPVEQAAK